MSDPSTVSPPQPDQPLNPPNAKPPETPSSPPKAASARALTRILELVEQMRREQVEVDQRTDKGELTPSIPTSNFDATMQLGFSIADKSGVLSKVLVPISLIGIKSAPGLKRANTHIEEAIAAMFLRPMMDSLHGVIMGWCEKAEAGSLTGEAAKRPDSALLLEDQTDDNDEQN